MIIVTFWIDLIFAFFYMQVITMIFWIELDIICAFCVQVITMVFWIVFDLISIFVCMHSVVSCLKNVVKCSKM